MTVAVVDTDNAVGQPVVVRPVDNDAVDMTGANLRTADRRASSNRHRRSEKHWPLHLGLLRWLR